MSGSLMGEAKNDLHENPRVSPIQTLQSGHVELNEKEEINWIRNCNSSSLSLSPLLNQKFRFNSSFPIQKPNYRPWIALVAKGPSIIYHYQAENKSFFANKIEKYNFTNIHPTTKRKIIASSPTRLRNIIFFIGKET